VKINPQSGTVIPFATDLPTFVSELAIESDNDILLTSPDGVFRYNAVTGAKTMATPASIFFSPNGIAVAPGTFTSPSGDFNNDGSVDGQDFIAWQQGESPTPMSATDLAAWKASYGSNSPFAAGVAVPEPTSVLLLLMSVTMVSAGRNRVSRQQ
jgi:hypothetical protein